jgi:hypothetical protein
MPAPVSQRLCVPEIPSVLRGLRVFVDDTADQIAAAGSERVEVSDGAGHLCVPRISSTALTSRVAFPAVRP